MIFVIDVPNYLLQNEYSYVSGNNTLQGSIPTSLGSLDQLVTFDIGEKFIARWRLMSIASLIIQWNCRNTHFYLQIYYLLTIITGKNDLNGTIPNELANITKLKYMSLGKCRWQRYHIAYITIIDWPLNTWNNVWFFWY